MQYLPSLFVIHTQRLTHTYRQLRASKSYNRFEEDTLGRGAAVYLSRSNSVLHVNLQFYACVI